MRRQFHSGAGRIALVAVLTTLSIVGLYLSSFLPTGRIGVVAIAGLVPAVAVVSGGLSTGFFCYGATALLSFLLVPNKGTMLFYILFFGIYPMIKSLSERLRRPILEWVLKLLFFNAVMLFLWFVLQELVFPLFPTMLDEIWWIFIVGNVLFVIYDIGFSKLIQFYTQRVDRIIRK